jgi:hypothetical protein
MQPTVLLTTLGTLAQPSGMNQLRQRMQSVQEPLDAGQVQQLQSFLKSELASYPRLAKTRLRVGPTGMGGGAYLPDKNVVSVDRPDLAIMGHELGHAKSIQSSGEAYKLLQNISRRLWKLNTLVALPAAAAVAALVAPGAAQAQAFNRLTAASIGLAAPVLVEEAGASLDAMSHVPDKLHATAKLLPGFASYVAMAAVPPVVYQLSKRFLRG